MSVPQNLTESVEGIIKNKGELFSSFDVDAFEVPGGRDELWRFTPLKRLRGLHDGSAPATGAAQIQVTEQEGVTVETVQRGDERLGQGGVPADRVAAQAFSSFESATATRSAVTPAGASTLTSKPSPVSGAWSCNPRRRFSGVNRHTSSRPVGTGWSDRSKEPTGWRWEETSRPISRRHLPSGARSAG